MNPAFAENVHEFTRDLFKAMLAEFDGKEVGSDECNLDIVMQFHFQDYKPGDKVKKVKKAVDPNKPKRALSGYTYFGQQNKEKINEAKKDDEKYVETLSKMWKAQTDEERNEWKAKAAAAAVVV